MRGLIVAISEDCVIGLHGKVPWRYPGDMTRFRSVTMGTTVVMGRVTWESLPKKPLVGRRNVVLSKKAFPTVQGVEFFRDIEAAIESATGDVWIIGGGIVYTEALKKPGLIDVLDVTYIPVTISHPDAIRFPEIDLDTWEEGPLNIHENEPRLSRRTYRKREPSRLSQASGI